MDIEETWAEEHKDMWATKEEAEKQVAEFDKVQPIHSGSKCPDCEGVIEYVRFPEWSTGEHLQCSSCDSTFNFTATRKPRNKIMKEEKETWAEEHKDMWATKAWREMRDVDAIEAERDKYKKALEDLKDWIEEQEGVWSMDIGLGNDGAGETPYFAVLKKIEELIENK